MQDPNCDINRKYFHDISRLRDVLYQVSEEIAYHMYQKGNQSFCLSDHEVSKIVERLSSQIHILKHANMQDITERCYALCCYAILNGSNFTNADIHYASLENASLEHCNMTGVDLRGTELPDGFMSAEQAEQVEHLKSLQIPGLII